MHVKISMRAVEKDRLSVHELKRCRASAKGWPWEVWEEDIWWWSQDRQSWSPLDEPLWPRRRRWLMLLTEEGTVPALLWEAGEPYELPSLAEEGEEEPLEEPALHLQAGLQEDPVVDQKAPHHIAPLGLSPRVPDH